MFEFAYKDIIDESPSAMRAQERQALDSIIRMLQEASAKGAKSVEAINALYQLRRLWGVFIDDLKSPENGLPETLRARLISIGIWVNKEIDRLRTGSCSDFTPLDRDQRNHPRRPELRGAMNITLRAGERLFINGAVIRTDRKATIELLNDATFLLETHVMQASDATTPLRQIYFVIQVMLMDPASAKTTAELALALIEKALSAFEHQEVQDGTPQRHRSHRPLRASSRR